MRMAAHKIASYNRKATPSSSTFGARRVSKNSLPPVDIGEFPSPRTNRDSGISEFSSITRESVGPVTPLHPTPPIPTPPVPAIHRPEPIAPGTPTSASNRDSNNSTESQIVQPVPIAPRITAGTYHDASEHVVHRFGGTLNPGLPERSGSSLGHRTERASLANQLPERSRSSLGHNAANDFETRFPQPGYSKALMKKLQKDREKSNKEALKAEKQRKKEQKEAKRKAERANNATLLQVSGHGQWV
ncbi:hypothetical protein ABW19_dt0202498 [Dactylella cylindrospora]|nr:hypothetical protein ABW19_dt0202498 [Dactylella cylindrospora]